MLWVSFDTFGRIVFVWHRLLWMVWSHRTMDLETTFYEKCFFAEILWTKCKSRKIFLLPGIILLQLVYIVNIMSKNVIYFLIKRNYSTSKRLHWNVWSVRVFIDAIVNLVYWWLIQIKFLIRELWYALCFAVEYSVSRSTWKRLEKWNKMDMEQNRRGKHVCLCQWALASLLLGIIIIMHFKMQN